MEQGCGGEGKPKAQKFALQQTTNCHMVFVDEGNLLINSRDSFTYHPKMGRSTDLSNLLLENSVMEIAGAKCTVCGKQIVLAKEGKFCGRCQRAVHLDCDPSECPVCRGSYTEYVPPKADALAAAFVPRALRPSNSAAGILLLIAGLAFVFYILYYLFEDALAHGH
jgi:hypothetical protein